MVTLQQLRERKLVQWALAYLAGAWVVLEVAGFVGEQFGWPSLWLRVLTVVLGIGFFAALVLAWYHGEQGRQKVSTVELGLLAGVLVLAAVGVGWVRVATGTAPAGADGDADPAPATPLTAELMAAEQGSIAVLPFENMSPDPDNEFFSDGITEELLNVLAQLPELRVAARTSSFAFKGKDVGIDSIARALNVRHVLEGSVRKAGERVRITAQLIDAETGYHLWSQSYDRDVRDVFAVQDEISRAIVDQLQIRLSGRDAALAEVQTTDSEAHALVLRGRQVVFLGGGEPRTWLLPAERLFEQAIARDSGYAAAWAGLANVRRLMVAYGMVPAEAGIEQARTYAERALTLDPHHGNAHLVLGIAAMIGGGPDAEGHFERALESNPGDARTLGTYGFWLSGQGRMDEAQRAARRAVALDPLSATALLTAGQISRRAGDLAGADHMLQRANALVPDDPGILRELAFTRALLGQRTEAIELASRAVELVPGSAGFLGQLAWVHAYARDFDRAVELYREAVALEPDNALSRAYLGNALVMVDEPAEAVEQAERAVQLNPDNSYIRTIRAFVYARTGRREAAMQALAEIPENALLDRAAVLAAVGQSDEAFALLDRAVEARAPGIVELGADWWFDDLRDDPRLARLLARVGVPDVTSIPQVE